MFGEIIGGANAHHALHFRRAEAGDSLVVEIEHASGIAEQQFAVGRDGYGTAVALKDGAANRLLQLLDLHGNGRGRPKHLLGGAGETAGLRNRHE